MRLLADSTLPNINALFAKHFNIEFYKNLHEFNQLKKNSQILLCRSTLKVDGALLSNSTIKYVATASSGTCHLDLDYFANNNIKAFDAKGCNAHAVSDYVVATISYLQKFNYLYGHKIGLIGFGHVGRKVFATLKKKFDFIIYDPLINDTQNLTHNLQDLIDTDLILIHCNLHRSSYHPSKNLINGAFLSKLKPNHIIINAARGGIVDENALLSLDKKIIYCTDVYESEPNVNPKIIDYATLCTPHIAGHSIEAKINAVAIIAQQIAMHFGLPFEGEYLSPNYNIAFDDILEHFNPKVETNLLKSTRGKNFNALRAEHIFRHDFNKN